MMHKIPKLFELITSESFRKRPGMYLGAKDIRLLDAFLVGIQYTIDAYEVKEDWLLEGFHEWVANYYHWGDTSAGWKDIILKECGQDEALSVDEFFKLYDVFITEKEQTNG